MQASGTLNRGWAQAKGLAIVKTDQSEASPKKFAVWFLNGQVLGLEKSISLKAGGYFSKQ